MHAFRLGISQQYIIYPTYNILYKKHQELYIDLETRLGPFGKFNKATIRIN